MTAPMNELTFVLRQLNPWWQNSFVPEVPSFRRSPMRELQHWLKRPTSHRAVLLSGCRNVGKSTLLQQSIHQLLMAGVSPVNILYVNFDYPMFRMAGIEATLEAWRQLEPRADGVEYLFIDEPQLLARFETWVETQVDTIPKRRIFVACSSQPLPSQPPAAKLSRWHEIHVAPLSFYEYLQLNRVALPPLPKLVNLSELFEWTPQEFVRIRLFVKSYVGHFHEYLVRGGFPATAQLECIADCQQILREEVASNLRRDTTALFGVRSILDLEHTFLYLCMNGELLDMQVLCAHLKVKRPTVEHFLELLEAIHLIRRLTPHGYGKNVLRARHKIYLADAAIAPAMMWKGKALLDDPEALEVAAETAVFRHLFGRFGSDSQFSYWRQGKSYQIDLVEQVGRIMIPFTVKYREQPASPKELRVLGDCCNEKQLPRGYVVTKSCHDFGEPAFSQSKNLKLIRLPAPLLCYWLDAV